MTSDTLPSRNAIKHGREIVETESKEDLGRERLELHHKMIGLIGRVQELNSRNSNNRSVNSTVKCSSTQTTVKQVNRDKTIYQVMANKH